MKKSHKIVIFSITATLLMGVSIIFGNSIVKNNKENNENNKIEDIIIDNSAEEYNLSDYITEDIRQKAQQSIHSLCLAEEFTPQKMYELATDVAIVKVVSKDYMDPHASSLGMTFGKILINNVISGNLEVGQVVTYEKPGGYVDMESWEESQPAAATEKRRYLREQAGITIDLSEEYINILADEDIEIEVGKTYLAYLTYNTTYNAYEIIGLGNGLREVNIPQETKSVATSNLNINELKIKNNTTGEWESLNTYVQQNIESLEQE